MAEHMFVDAVPLGRVFLQLDNPRHDPVKSEADAIAKLCDKEDVLPLARDIVRYGLSPLERFAMVPAGSKRRSSKPDTSYLVAEGNRRICALKLLNDPDLAPPTLRKSFEKLADGWSVISVVPAAIFPSLEDVRIWLDRVHSGPQGGIGRKGWNADQKQRFWGGNKNRLAQMLLDYAESQGMINEDQREGKLTTAQRFLSNPIFRENLGLDTNNDEELNRNRPKVDFDTLIKRFVTDLIGGKAVNSRMNKDAIQGYARTLSSTNGISAERIESEPLAAIAPTKRGPQRKPKKPKHAKTIQYEADIYAALKSFGNGKLESLYYSITAIELESHTPLVCIGAWALFESLTACIGRKDGTSFNDFFSKHRLNNDLGVPGDTRALRSAVSRISDYGNITKHHPIALTLNGDQLNNDMVALKDVILKCIETAIAAKP